MRDRLDKLEGVAASAPTFPGISSTDTVDPIAEAVDVLIALGYKPPEASRMVRSVKAEGLSSEEIIRAALKAVVK